MTVPSEDVELEHYLNELRLKVDLLADLLQTICTRVDGFDSTSDDVFSCLIRTDDREKVRRQLAGYQLSPQHEDELYSLGSTYYAVLMWDRRFLSGYIYPKPFNPHACAVQTAPPIALEWLSIP